VIVVTDKMTDAAARVLNKRLADGSGLHGVSRAMLEAALAVVEDDPPFDPATPVRIRKGCRWKSGPVTIHMIDGRTALVSRTNSISRQKWWISLDSLEIAHD
jgi:hypothetical protein